jgi:hypothetical protein
MFDLYVGWWSWVEEEEEEREKGKRCLKAGAGDDLILLPGPAYYWACRRWAVLR